MSYVYVLFLAVHMKIVIISIKKRCEYLLMGMNEVDIRKASDKHLHKIQYL